MNRLTRAAAAAPAMSLIALMAFAGPANAADGSTQAQLQPLNESSASGSAMVTVSGNMLTVKLASQGLLADQPHAAHIHFAAEAHHECPIARDDTNGDGHIDTTEGDPAYGEVVVSLTKTGDIS